MARGFMVSAPHSGSGKTTLTLGMLRAFHRSGLHVRAAKAGPDFIDPAFHAVACKNDCINLDPWAMRPAFLSELASHQSDGEAFVVEAAMGLFDGARDGSGSAAELAKTLGLPVVLVVDCSGMAQSVAVIARGFRLFDPAVRVAGVILNRVGSQRHEAMLREALEAIDVPVFGVVTRDPKLALPSRHLGLVQAAEHGDLNAFIDHAADVCERQIDLDALLALSFERSSGSASSVPPAIAPLGQHIAVARDEAFAFAYPHILDGWQRAGAQISEFSPLADAAPAEHADAVFLPGGYPELHAARLASCERFQAGLRSASERGAFIYGECGGYMVLGEALIDSEGRSHKMAGLLPLVTSFEARKLHLGYRIVTTRSPSPLADKGQIFRAHEFHYTSAVEERAAEALFDVTDATGAALPSADMQVGTVAGSYMHLIDRATGA